MEAKFNVENKAIMASKIIFHQKTRFIIAYQNIDFSLNERQQDVDKNFKFMRNMRLPAVLRSLKNSFIILSTPKHGIHFDLQNKFDH
jgi:hypothetical protein